MITPGRKTAFVVTAGLLVGMSALERALHPFRPTDQKLTAGNNLYGEINSAPGEIIKKGPVYDDSVVPANNCSRYVRLAAKDLFGIDYPADDAWNLRNYTSGVEVERVTNLREMLKSEKIKNGDILAVYNPTSKYNSKGAAKKAGYTHVILYLGHDESGEGIFADKFGSKTRTHMTVAEIERSNLKPVEILHPKKK